MEFQSTPHAGRLADCIAQYATTKVSIHAPCGATHIREEYLSVYWRFQSTPHAGRLNNGYSDDLSIDRFNPRPMRGDSDFSLFFPRQGIVSIHAPCGATHLIFCSSRAPAKFQSTPHAGRLSYDTPWYIGITTVSIHAPCGATP